MLHVWVGAAGAADDTAMALRKPPYLLAEGFGETATGSPRLGAGYGSVIGALDGIGREFGQRSCCRMPACAFGSFQLHPGLPLLPVILQPG